MEDSRDNVGADNEDLDGRAKNVGADSESQTENKQLQEEDERGTADLAHIFPLEEEIMSEPRRTREYYRISTGQGTLRM